MRLALSPVGDRSADAARATGVHDELEAEQADVLDDLEPPVAQVQQRGVVLVALLPPRLQPERHGSRRARYLADVGDLDLCLGLVCRVAAVEGDVGPRGRRIAGARVRGPGLGAPRARLSRPRRVHARRGEATRRLVANGARGEGAALPRGEQLITGELPQPMKVVTVTVKRGTRTDPIPAGLDGPSSRVGCPADHGVHPFKALWTHPVPDLQESAVQRFPSSQLRAVPAPQTPDWQVSVPLHTFPSLHDVPLSTGAYTHPLVGLQLSAVQGLPSSHLRGLPLQIPP